MNSRREDQPTTDALDNGNQARRIVRCRLQSSPPNKRISLVTMSLLVRPRTGARQPGGPVRDTRCSRWRERETTLWTNIGGNLCASWEEIGCSRSSRFIVGDTPARARARVLTACSSVLDGSFRSYLAPRTRRLLPSRILAIPGIVPTKRFT